jgi:hypothetical protein
MLSIDLHFSSAGTNKVLRGPSGEKASVAIKVIPLESRYLHNVMSSQNMHKSTNRAVRRVRPAKSDAVMADIWLPDSVLQGLSEFERIGKTTTVQRQR